jgi:hypothetical protein
MKLYFKGNANGNLSYSVDGGNTFVPTSLQALRDGVPLPDDTDYSSVKVKANSTILGTLDIIKQIEVSEGSNGIEIPVDMRLHNSSGDECDLFSRESLFNFDYDTIHKYLSATYSYNQIYLKTVNNKYISIGHANMSSNITLQYVYDENWNEISNILTGNEEFAHTIYQELTQGAKFVTYNPVEESLPIIEETNLGVKAISFTDELYSSEEEYDDPYNDDSSN